ncbi:A-kinase anchor protein 17A-like isoform X2 [Osmia bicornis bicornis]|uniref:A-kinase anchor protein 17A-like isoform X2 n=1 Tax=Osmia bicornis bicornis TaxID=1437191 RepID=UPI001EAEF50C|nr:A-kinase anchor protein 17A-like isoform X2 [Osmia bicornis bicornis]
MNDGKKVGENSSSEVVNQFRSCRDLSDIVPLYMPRSLYLKPIAKINVSVNLPQLKVPGKTISTWEVMEKIRAFILPDEFASLKVAKSTLEFIRLEGDLQDRCRLQRVLARLDSQRLNLSGFPNVLKVRAAEAKDDFPTRHRLPVKWFIEDGGTLPSESVITKIFKKWGTLRRIDVPAADAYRSRMRLGTNINKFSYEDGIFFDAYIQYVEYMDFVRTMDALRGMKLLKKEGEKAFTAAIKIDFDKTKHMSDSSVAHREFERKRLIAQDTLAAERLRRKEEAEEKRREEQKKKEEADAAAKEIRRRKREEKRKRKVLTKFRKKEEDKVSMKIAREGQKLIKAQRQLESIRLLDELFDRIKIKLENNEITIDEVSNADLKKDEKKNNKIDDGTEALSSDDNSKEGKKDKKAKKSKKKKSKKEKKKKKKPKKGKDSENTASLSEDSGAEEQVKKLKSVLKQNVAYPSSSTTVTSLESLSYPTLYPRFPQPWCYEAALPMLYPSFPRGMPRGGRFLRGRGRGFAWRNAGNPRAVHTFNPHLYNEQYYKYFAHLVGQDYHSFDYRSSRSRSRKGSFSRSRSRTRSKSKSRSRSRSKSCSRSRSRSPSKSRSKSRSRSKVRTKSRSRSKRRSKSKSRSRSRRRRGRSKTRSRSSSKVRSRSRRSRSKKKSRSRSRSKVRNNTRNRYRRRRERSISKVKITRAKSRSMSPKRRSRSRTWSMPKSPGGRRRSCSWSKGVDAVDRKAETDKSLQATEKKTENKEASQVSHLENITSD